jgi:predicted GIY-YIG superfamily endonuclease
METVVYCLENSQNGRTYVGVTDHFRRRLRQHKQPLALSRFFQEYSLDVF